MKSSAISHQTILVTGGAGYVGCVLVPKLLSEGHRVKVLDLYYYGANVLDHVKGHPALEEIKGDIRDQSLLQSILPGCDAVIHLACISNDPSFELDPELGKSINYDAFEPLVRLSKEAGVRRFIYASTSSVYGVSNAEKVTEEHPLKPLTDYSKYKALCEPVLLSQVTDDFTGVVIRPATVCGYSPRMRLDLTVNILTNHAVNKGKITVYGGDQKRPNIHIEDITDLYLQLIEHTKNKISGKIFNAGYENHTVADLANIVRNVVEEEMPEKKPIEIVTTPTEDQRSYHICSEKIRKELGFVPKRTIKDAVRDLIKAFREGNIPNAFADSRYYNVRWMKEQQTLSAETDR